MWLCSILPLFWVLPGLLFVRSARGDCVVFLFICSTRGLSDRVNLTGGVGGVQVYTAGVVADRVVVASRDHRVFRLEPTVFAI